MTLLVLARHGNTFEPGQTAAWVGARSDLPLVETGREQARRIGVALFEGGFEPEHVLAGPLRRTRETATLALQEAGFPLERIGIDERLREIDYGDWEGLTSDEIRGRGGAAELEAWERDNSWPSQARWPLSRKGYVERLRGVVESLATSGYRKAMIVSSNGLFRLLGDLLDSGEAPGKIRTGHMALLHLDGRENIRLLGWDLPPGQFAARLRAQAG